MTRISVTISSEEFGEDYPEGLFPRCLQTSSAEGLSGGGGEWRSGADERDSHQIRGCDG